LASAFVFGCGERQPQNQELRKLSHEETLEWINKNRAWQRAKKTKPMWARPVLQEELGREFQTADQAVERAQEGYWLCVGVAGEPWFQKPARIEAKFAHLRDETKRFAFDSEPKSYGVYQPKENLANWVAQVKGPGIAGFYIRPNYDVDHPLYAPAGGYVVKDGVLDPYRDGANDVWLVQEGIFNSTYEFVP
jgi:hypothetical protein